MSPWTNPDQSYTSVITILCKWNDAYIALFYSWAQSALYNTHTLFSIFFYLSAFYLIFTLQRATQVQGSCPSKLWHTDCSSRGSNRQTFDLQMICCFSRATSRLLDVALDQHPNIYMLGCWFDHCSNTSSLMKRIKTSTDRAQTSLHSEQDIPVFCMYSITSITEQVSLCYLWKQQAAASKNELIWQ